MQSLWPDKFDQSPVLPVKAILDEQAQILTELTRGTVYATVEPVDSGSSHFDGIRGSFNYLFLIAGRFLTNYKFRVMSFSHNIPIYPVKFRLDDDIGSELKIDKSIYSRYDYEIDQPEELEGFIKSILTSNKVKSVVGSIIKLSS